MNFQEKVKLFQLASGQPVSDKPRKLTKEEFDFRDNLLREEIRELREAIVDNNRVDILDALCDIKYVNDGTANMIGQDQGDISYLLNYDVIPFGYETFDKACQSYIDVIDDYDINNYCACDINHSVITLSKCFGFTKEKFLTALDRVHESNMSKFCNDTKTAELTQEFYSKQGIDTYLQPREKKTVVYRKEDGKVLKSIEYFPVYLDDLV